MFTSLPTTSYRMMSKFSLNWHMVFTAHTIHASLNGVLLLCSLPTGVMRSSTRGQDRRSSLLLLQKLPSLLSDIMLRSKPQWNHREFLGPEECQCLHGFSVARTNTPGSPPLCCVQSSAQCVLLSIQMKLSPIIAVNLKWSALTSQGTIPRRTLSGGLTKPCSPGSSSTSLPSCPCLCTQDISRPWR